MPPSATPTLRRLVWVYFWLLLFEGALRKWLVPGLSSALLIVRDPVVIAIYVLAFQRRLFPASLFLVATCVLGALCFFASFAGIGTLAITLYGMHADFLHLPLIVLLPRILGPEDVIKIGKALLFTLPPMMFLAVLQFKGGPDSHWNVGVGGEIGGQLYAAQGKVRASGTFSFSTGFATYLALCSTILLDSLLARRGYALWLTYLGVPALVLSVVVSGSRTAVISVSIVCVTALFICLTNAQRFGAALRPLILTLVAATVVSSLTPLFKEGIAVHQTRFVSAGGFRDGLLNRYGEEFVSAGHALYVAPLFGYGLGAGTNVGGSLLKTQRDFWLGENEWERIIMESGPILGVAFIALRCGTLLMIAAAAFKAYQSNQVLPLLLLSVTAPDLFTGPFGQPTALGFAVFNAGLALAAANPLPSTLASAGGPPPPASPPPIQGRSAYAQRLHGSARAPSPAP